MRAQRARWRAGAAALAAGALCLGAAACTPDGQTPAADTETPDGPAQVTVAVYGPQATASTYSTIASQFSARHPEVSVRVQAYASREQVLQAVQAGGAGAPDIFLSDHRDLDQVLSQRLTQPVSDMLTARNVDLGDNYQRIGIEDYSRDNALQCMPSEVSPSVVFYNTALVQLSALRPAGQPVPNSDRGWNFNDFVTAIQQASDRPGVRGLALAPTVEALAPFLFAGGSTVVDDQDDPTRLELSEGSGLSSMKRLLPVLRNSTQTVTPAELAQKSAVDRFESGQVAMIVGQRDLVPRLRAAPNLSFGVMPVPRLKTTATTGTVTGLCVTRAATASGSGAAAEAKETAVGDLLAYLVGDRAQTQLAATGYVVPADVTALNSDEFTDSDEDPLGGDTVFAQTVRYIQELPVTEDFPPALAAADPVLRPLFRESVSGPLSPDELKLRLFAVDQAAQGVLAPESPIPTPTPTATPSS